ncbi:hypothetical protein C8Q70DRAFT_594579 [Cubamyces menziesii]|nr:hypothetical protein C8Q70DRAFT_594579 [Cubamyces menziesii]
MQCNCQDSFAKRTAVQWINEDCPDSANDIAILNSYVNECNVNTGPTGPITDPIATATSTPSTPTSAKVSSTPQSPVKPATTADATSTGVNQQTSTPATSHSVATGTSSSLGTSESTSSISTSNTPLQTSPVPSGSTTDSSSVLSSPTGVSFNNASTSTLVSPSLVNTSRTSSSSLVPTGAVEASPTLNPPSSSGPSTTVVIALSAVLGLVVLVSVICGLSLCARRRRRRRAQQAILLPANDHPGSDENILQETLDEKYRADRGSYHGGSTEVQPSFPPDCVSTAPPSAVAVHNICADDSSVAADSYSILNSTLSPESVLSGRALEGAPLLQYGASEQESTAGEPEDTQEDLPLEAQASSSRRNSGRTVALPTITEADEEAPTPPPPPESTPPGIVVVPTPPVKSHEPTTTDTENPPATTASASATSEPTSSHALGLVPTEAEKDTAPSEKTSMSEDSTRAEIGSVVLHVQPAQAPSEPSAGFETATGGILVPPTATTPQYPDVITTGTTGQAAVTRESTVLSLPRISIGLPHPRFLAVLMDLQASDDQDLPPPYQPRPEGIPMPLPPHIPQEGPDCRAMS